MKNVLLLLLSLLVLGLNSCKTSEEVAAGKLHNASQQIKAVLRDHPELVDSLKTVVHDTICTPPVAGRTEIKLVLDTTKYNGLLNRYVDQRQQYIALLQQQNNQPGKVVTNPQLALLKRQNQLLRDSLQLGAFNPDSVYTYTDTAVSISAGMVNGVMKFSYRINGKKYAYISNQSTLTLHDCPPSPAFYSYWQFWAGCAACVLLTRIGSKIFA